MNRMLAGVSTRKFARVGEPVGEAVKQAASAKNKSTVSEMFIEKTRTALEELMARRLDDMRLAVRCSTGWRSPAEYMSSRSGSAPRG